MVTFLTFLGAIAIYVIGKFIYDTFLTNNTERDWQDYKSSNPHKARVIENNQGLNLQTSYNVRKDGLYVCRLQGVSPYDEPFKLTMFLIFNKMNRVIKDDADGFPEIDKSVINDMLLELSNHTELGSNCAEYYNNDGEINMRFISSSTHSEEYTGSVIKDGLILNRIVHYWDELKGGPNSRISLHDMRFEFVRAES